MAALKKFFQTDKAPSRPSTSLGYAEEPYFTGANLDAGLPSPALLSPGLHPSKSMDVDHHFQQIEKQFEDLHDQLVARPLSSQSQSPSFAPSHFTTFPKPNNGRHIDLMDALYSLQRYKTSNSQPCSPPSSPYNEDVAERNMTRFLRIQMRKGHTSSKILTALYQEDVADRNIAKYAGPSRSLSRLSCRSSPPCPGRVRAPNGPKRESKKRNSGKSALSDGNLRASSLPPNPALTGSSQESQSQNDSRLRPQRSAPSLSAEEKPAPQEDAAPPPVQRLGVPPAYKQGKRWSNTPLPDSPTLPMPLSDSGGAESPVIPPSPPPLVQQRPPASPARTSSLAKSRSLRPPSRPGSKNKRDLSINVQLAAKGRSKIAHRAIQPPTPSNVEMKRAPNIAEVMNSPLPTASPGPTASPRFKASEMMELFNKAYMTTQAVSPHPTYETLQDAIVREINDHEAFRRVPVPAAGPPFTPSPDREAFVNNSKSANTGLKRSGSGKDKQITKLMGKNSFMKHKRNIHSSRSISSVPSKGFLRKVSGSPARQRRHTDAPPPTPGFLADVQQQEQEEAVVPRLASSEQLTYMDFFFRAGSGQDKSIATAKSTSSFRRRGRSESAANFSSTARVSPEMPNTPTVYCLQAHSTPSKDSSSGSADDSDDDIIHLPSVGAAPAPPRVQIEGVDENNVRYVIDSASPSDAQKLMSWSRRGAGRGAANGNNNTASAYESSLSPLSRARVQLRGSRSVETY